MYQKLVRILLLGSVFGRLLPAVFSAEAGSPKEPVFELPKFTVTNPLLLPKPESWRYAKVAGFEVLSCASASETKHFLRDFQRLQQIMDIVWPSFREAAHPVPAMLVLYGSGRQPALMESSVKMMVGNDVIELQSLDDPHQPHHRTNSVFFADQEAGCIVVDLGSNGVGMDDPYRQFYREYVSHLFTRIDAPMAPWLREGTARLFAGVDFTDKWIKFGSVDSDRPGEFTNMLARQPLPPVRSKQPFRDQGTNYSPPPSVHRAAGQPGYRMGAFPVLAEMLQANEARFRSDFNFPYLAHAFVHMCLYGRGQQFQKAFITFIARTNGGTGSPEIFRECFGMTPEQMTMEIVTYVSTTNYNSIMYKTEKGQSLPVPPEVELRDATQAEIGRIKGHGLVLAGRRDLARVAFLAPYIRGQQDADLLAALGLYELDAGNASPPGRARNFLELAVKSGSNRVRAYLELARMRAADRGTVPEGSVATPPEGILALLRRAATLEPQNIEVYEFMAREWSQCSTPPPASDLALLEKGAVRFQRTLKLVYDTARLHAAGGLPEKAARLADWGVKNARAPADKERFAQLLATLPASPGTPN